ncbi:MAG: Enantioselective amidase [Frankiales bacterium]|nr:Enantioselective amidase [Frankiales bacterium]
MSSRPWGYLRAPESAQVAAYAARSGWTLSAEELQLYTEQVATSLAAIDAMEDLPEPSVPLKHSAYRDPGHRATPDEDPYNSVIQFCEVRGSATGPLAGKTLGVKDCIQVAGVPMTNGGRRQPVLVPTEDAVVIERLLDAGVTITAKTNLEDLGWGLGEGSAYGPARNPFDPSRSTGGSSSGSGSAVASGLVDLALGADEGGSVRIPAAWCGLVGMKATHGLVPSYGMSYMNHTLDHIGPMTKTVHDNALMLEVMAGPDWRDPQWTTNMPAEAGHYTAAAGKGIKGLKVGILIESLEPVGVTPDVLAAFEQGAKTLTALGAEVTQVSVPLWAHGWAIASAGLAAGSYFMTKSYGTGGFQHLGRIDPQAVATLAAQSELGGNDTPTMAKTLMLTAEHVNSQYYGIPFVKAHNLRLELRKQLEAALAGVDIIITPTTPAVAHKLLSERSGPAPFIRGRLGSATANCAPTDLTGHPSLTVPCGTGEDDLPVGLQFVGPRYSEELLYQAGFAFEGA